MIYMIIKGTYTRGRLDKGSESVVKTCRTLQDAVDYCKIEVRKHEFFYGNDAKLIYRYFVKSNGQKKTTSYMVIGIGAFLAIPKDLRVMPNEVEGLWA